MHLMPFTVFRASSSDGEESVSNAGDMGWTPGWGRSPGEGNGKPAPVFSPGESYGQRSLVGYSLRGRKELGTTLRLTLRQAEH